MRFAQALGYEGFSDLQTVFHSLLRNRWPDYEDRLRVALAGRRRRRPEALLAGFCESAALSLSRLRERISGEALERGHRRAGGADTIYVLGQRRTFAVAAYLAYAFAKLKIRCVLVDNVGSLGPDQVAFASGQGRAPRRQLRALHALDHRDRRRLAQRLPVVAITEFGLLAADRSARVWFEVAEADFGAFRAVSGTFALAMTLAVGIGQKRSAGTLTAANHRLP